MKTFMILAIVSLAASAYARPPEMDRNLDTHASRLTREKVIVVPQEKEKNKIVGRRVTYSGIVVQAIKADNPLQLVNPLAPEKYGNGEDNVTREPTTGKVHGLKLFSIEF